MNKVFLKEWLKYLEKSFQYILKAISEQQVLDHQTFYKEKNISNEK